VLLEVERHLTTGCAVSLVLWHSQDQSGNRENTTLASAHSEHITDRAELSTGDMTELPFEDASFEIRGEISQ
jgi:hypothetical protein